MGGRHARWLAAIAVCGTLISGEARAAGGAFAVDDAGVDEPGACKVESWLSFASNQDFIGATTPACVIRLFRPTEVGLQVAHARAGGEWATGVTPKAKMSVLPAEVGQLGLAVAGGGTFDARTGQGTGAFVNVPLTYTVSDTFKININGGWSYDSINVLHYVTYGAGIEWIPLKPFTVIAEVFGIAGRQGDPRSITEPRFQAGLRVTPIDTIDFDLIYGRNITGENANWITVGMNVRFPVK